MTEEMIIDGVDVSECEYFNPKYESCHCYNTKEECYAINPNENHSCKGVNCCFKRLKRAEQKLERIEDRVQDLDNYSEKNVEIMEDILTIIQGE